MQADYQHFVERMISRYEGGYGWNKHDPGGPTKFGITCFDLAEFMHEKMDSMNRWAPIVKSMSLATTDQIYANKYATACHFNDLGAGSDCVVFDFGVNSGPSRAIRYAQNVVGVDADGVIGPVTLQAINRFNPNSFITKICEARLRFLEGLGTWHTFGKGWAARVADLRSYSLGLVNHSLSEDSFRDRLELIPGAFAKGYVRSI